MKNQILKLIELEFKTAYEISEVLKISEKETIEILKEMQKDRIVERQKIKPKNQLGNGYFVFKAIPVVETIELKLF